VLSRCHAGGVGYLNNRYHDPTLGHFITVDPIVGQTGQPYLYANGNPSTMSDPSGLFGVMECGDAGQACSTEAFAIAQGSPSGGSSLQDGSSAPVQRNSDFEEMGNHIISECMIRFNTCEAWSREGGISAVIYGYLNDLVFWGVLSIRTNGAGERWLDAGPGVPSRNTVAIAIVGTPDLFALSFQAYHIGNKEELANVLSAVGFLASIVEVIGYALCPFTAGVGCAVGKGAGTVGTVAGIGSAILSCTTPDNSTGCALDVASSVVDVGFTSVSSFLGKSFGTHVSGPPGAQVRSFGVQEALGGATPDLLALYADVMGANGGLIFTGAMSVIPTGDGGEVGLTQTTVFQGMDV